MRLFYSLWSGFTIAYLCIRSKNFSNTSWAWMIQFLITDLIWAAAGNWSSLVVIINIYIYSFGIIWYFLLGNQCPYQPVLVLLIHKVSSFRQTGLTKNEAHALANNIGAENLGQTPKMDNSRRKWTWSRKREIFRSLKHFIYMFHLNTQCKTILSHYLSHNPNRLHGQYTINSY